MALACATAEPAPGSLLPLARIAAPPALPGTAAPPALHRRTPANTPSSYEFFGRPEAHDPWTLRIGRWQMRQAAARRSGLLPAFPTPPRAPGPVGARPGSGPAAAHPAGSLSAHYDDFLSQSRRELARRVLAWVQAEAETRFVEDGPIDQWPTLPEVLRAEGDDCDGLELLAYHALRQLGFSGDRVYRAILRGPGAGRYHMVTLWFEDARDPWVLDPTATIVRGLHRLSEISRWVPVKVFSETREFTVSSR